MSENKDDFIAKRVNDSTKLFGMIEKDTKSYVILFLTALSATFIYLYISAKNENISLNSALNKQIQDEIRRQLPNEVEKQVRPIEKGVNSATAKIDTLIQNVTR